MCNLRDPFGLAAEAEGGSGCPPECGQIDKDALVKWMQENALTQANGQCAAYCRRGMEAGGMDMRGHPAEAKDYGPFLLKKGATEVSPEHYAAEKGDIAVFEANSSHKFGHIQVYDGKQWISDFKQLHYSPYGQDIPASKIYRFPDKP